MASVQEKKNHEAADIKTPNNPLQVYLGCENEAYGWAYWGTVEKKPAYQTSHAL